MGLLISKTKVYEDGRIYDRSTGKLLSTESDRRSSRKEKSKEYSARIAAEKLASKAPQPPTLAERAITADKALHRAWHTANADPTQQVVSNVQRIDEGDAPEWNIYLCPSVKVSPSLRAMLQSGTDCHISDERHGINGTIISVKLNNKENDNQKK